MVLLVSLFTSTTTSLLICFIVTLIILFHYKMTILSNHRSKNLPPSPKGSLPIIGHIHLLGKIFHRSLHEFTNELGPIFSLKFGPKLVVVVSSASLVEECFNKNDIILANRPILSMERRSLGVSPTTVLGSPYGAHWRNLRKLLDLEVFAPARLASFLATRRDEMNRMIASLYRSSSSGFAKVNLETKIVEVTFNNILRMVSGKRYYGEEAEDDEEAKEFRELTKEALELTVASNPGEYFPILRWLGFNGIGKRLAVHARKTDDFLKRLLNEHRQGKRQNTMVDHLLSLQADQPKYYTDDIITGLVIVLIIAGTDASAVAAEWVMTFLLNNPQVLSKARQEIDAQVGHDRIVEEDDLPKLRYLRCIVLETLRLFPSVPTLVPHENSRDCVIGGYNVPKGTMLLANAWAVHRDPNVWEDPLSFKPERFESIESVENHKLLPFGMGRRSCPGAVLAHKFVGLAVASLVQCFDWERTTSEKIDLSEGEGFTLAKAEALEAMCKPRNVMTSVLEQVSSNYL